MHPSCLAHRLTDAERDEFETRGYLVLPDALGFETAKAINAHPATQDVPVVFMTGYPYLRAYSGMENCSLLLKPFTMQAIVDAVKEALATRTAPQESRA